jgi:transposase
MASLQAYQSHGIRYFRIVESYRKNGKPAIRVLAHLGQAADILRLHQQDRDVPFQVSSVSAGAVTAVHRLAAELDIAGRIDRAISPDSPVQTRDGLSVGQSLVAAMIARACAPRSKRAFPAWAASTCLPNLMSFAPGDLTSQHFWDPMHAVPVRLLGQIEHDLVRHVVQQEQLQLRTLAYDTTNFFTHIASTNRRSILPERGHNKQGRHDLRQMGLALIVDQASQLPLAHSLYPGARSDMRTFADFVKPLAKRLTTLSAGPQQLTLVFDAGASSRQNLTDLRKYVTCLRPSAHKGMLAEASAQLSEVVLSTGTKVQAWRQTRVIAGQSHEVVVVFSQKLFDGQLRGLHQAMARAGQQLAELGTHPRGTVQQAERRLNAIRAKQYLRSLLQYRADGNGVSVWTDWIQYRKLLAEYLGLRILITDRSDWSTAEIIEAYRGQSRAEAAFRDLKDPVMLATRPQFHWTDQKLHVHAFICVTAYLLVTLLHRHASQRAGYHGSSRSLLAALSTIRCSRIADITGKPGRPRVRWQTETLPEDLADLANALQAIPKLR